MWHYAVIVFVLTHLTTVSVTIFLHRHQAHRSLTLHPVASHFFRFWIWLTTGMVTSEWVAVHRKHHATVETEDDPHSPQVLGLWRVLLGGGWVYAKAVRQMKKEGSFEKYIAGVPNDWLEKNFYSRYAGLGLVVMGLIDFLLFGVVGIAIWVIQMMWIPLAGGVINGLGHWFGYRNFDTADASTNVSPIGIVFGGEELHSNHHAFPSSAKLSLRWWEFDISWLYICILKLCGLARVKRVALLPVINIDKNDCDAETVRAIMTDRLTVMADYDKNILYPVVKEEKLCKRVKKMLLRQLNLQGRNIPKDLSVLLEKSKVLKTVYHFKMRLQDVWNNTKKSNANRLQALKTWCEEAKATGIKALQDFAQKIKGYSYSIQAT